MGASIALLIRRIDGPFAFVLIIGGGNYSRITVLPYHYPIPLWTL